MIRTVAFFLTVAVVLSAQLVMPSGTEPMLETFEPIQHTGKNLVCTDPDAAKCAALWLPDPTPKQAALPAQITIRATHQSLDTMAAYFGFDGGKVPKQLKRTAFYSVMACGNGRVSTDEIRFALAGKLSLVPPALGMVTVDARARGARAWLDLGATLAPGGSLAVTVSNTNEVVRGVVFVLGLGARLYGNSKAQPLALHDPGHLDLEGGCDSYVTLANWPSRGRGPEFVEVTIAR